MPEQDATDWSTPIPLRENELPRTPTPSERLRALRSVHHRLQTISTEVAAHDVGPELGALDAFLHVIVDDLRLVLDGDPQEVWAVWRATYVDHFIATMWRDRRPLDEATSHDDVQELEALRADRESSDGS